MFVKFDALIRSGLRDAGKTDEEIANLLHITTVTVAETRKCWCADRLSRNVVDRPKPGRKRKLDGKQEAFLVALACSDAPEGREHWPLRMLSDKLLELGVVDGPVSYETVRDRLQKNELKPWLKQQWCIPTVGADFVWRMEDVLDLYAEPFKPCLPVVCFDERPCILRADTRPSLPMKPGRLTRQDYEYERRGTCNYFIFFQLLAGWRQTTVTAQRRKEDFAECMRELVNVHFPYAEKIRVVLDNLNTHAPSSLYEAFEPAEARRILNKLELHFTAKHGSWLNMVEIELSVLGALRACDLSSRPLTPSCHQRFSVVYTVCLLTAKYSAMEATDHPSAWSCTMLWRRCAGSGVSLKGGKRRIWIDGGGPEASTILIE